MNVSMRILCPGAAFCLWISAGLTVAGALAGRTENSAAALFSAEIEAKPLAESSGPKLQVSKPTHDFGTVKHGQMVRHEFMLANIGDQPLDITEVRPSCGCTTAGEWTRTIPAGGSGTIPIQLDTARFSGSVAKTITVTSNDRTQPQMVLEIKADIWTPIKLTPSVVVFPALTHPDRIATSVVRIVNQGETPVTITEVKSEAPVFKAEVREVQPGKEFELMITTVAPMPPGTSSARISMKTSNPDMPILAVQSVATLLPPVQVAPTQIILPGAKLAAAEKRYVVILNHRASDLVVSDLKSNVEGVGVSMNENPANRQFTIILTFPAGFQARGSEKMLFSGRTNHPELPTFEVPITYARSP